MCIDPRFEISKIGHFATGHSKYQAKSDTSHFRWREIGHVEHTFEVGHFEHGARHSQRVSGAVFKVSDFEGVFKVSDFAPSKMRVHTMCSSCVGKWMKANRPPPGFASLCHR